ncbi:ribonuclease T2-like [Tulasnella sp. 424]|nr:ribonuclease T2-like [Tulasnella sp. 424]KAG8973789.1 ribonuclease T2-like [Tulasnella sp. 425]
MSAAIIFSTLGMAAFALANPLIGLSARQLGHPAFITGCSTPHTQLSCHNTTIQENTCCFENPGGLIMQVQLWDTYPKTGADDEWTVHGLWPDNCDGTWGQFCDPSREYPSVTQVLKDNHRDDLLDWMGKHWLDQNGDNESFWEHEWNKHGTCMSTLEAKCMPKGSKNGTDAVAYFQTAINLHRAVPTYKILAAAGIFPSANKSYTYDELTSAVKKEMGYIPAFDCDKNIIFEISYYYNLRGSVVDGTWQHIDAFTGGSCPKTGPLWYLPKGVAAPAGQTTSASPSSTAASTSTVSASTTSPTTSGTPTSGKYILDAVINGTAAGCLLSKGTWAATGPSITCAKFTFASSDNVHYTLTSSKGPCAVDEDGGLSCDATIQSPSSFKLTLVNDSNELTYQGLTIFSSSAVPQGSAQQNVKLGCGPADSEFALILRSS